MFDAEQPLFNRALSFFHFWLPILLVWMVWRLGYNRRALWPQIALAFVVLALSYVFTTYPAGPAGNVNKVLGPGGDKDPPQAFMHPLLWLGVLIVGTPVVFYVPSHFLMKWLMPRREDREGGVEFGLPPDVDRFRSTAEPSEQVTDPTPFGTKAAREG
jgi:hypothetical protein